MTFAEAVTKIRNIPGMEYYDPENPDTFFSISNPEIGNGCVLVRVLVEARLLPRTEGVTDRFFFLRVTFDSPVVLTLLMPNQATYLAEIHVQAADVANQVQAIVRGRSWHKDEVNAFLGVPPLKG